MQYMFPSWVLNRPSLRVSSQSDHFLSLSLKFFTSREVRIRVPGTLFSVVRGTLPTKKGLQGHDPGAKSMSETNEIVKPNLKQRTCKIYPGEPATFRGRGGGGWGPCESPGRNSIYLSMKGTWVINGPPTPNACLKGIKMVKPFVSRGLT